MAPILHPVLVGKLSSPQVSGQLSHGNLPETFAGLQTFSAEEIAEFFTELPAALEKAKEKQGSAKVTEVLTSRNATAEGRSDSDLMPQLDVGLREILAIRPRGKVYK